MVKAKAPDTTPPRVKLLAETVIVLEAVSVVAPVPKFRLCNVPA